MYGPSIGLRKDTISENDHFWYFACGDNSTIIRSASYIVATSGVAGSMINNELSMEVF